MLDGASVADGLVRLRSVASEDAEDPVVAAHEQLLLLVSHVVHRGDHRRRAEFLEGAVDDVVRVAVPIFAADGEDRSCFVRRNASQAISSGWNKRLCAIDLAVLGDVLPEGAAQLRRELLLARCGVVREIFDLVLISTIDIACTVTISAIIVA